MLGWQSEWVIEVQIVIVSHSLMWWSKEFGTVCEESHLQTNLIYINELWKSSTSKITWVGDFDWFADENDRVFIEV